MQVTLAVGAPPGVSCHRRGRPTTHTRRPLQGAGQGPHAALAPGSPAPVTLGLAACHRPPPPDSTSPPSPLLPLFQLSSSLQGAGWAGRQAREGEGTPGCRAPEHPCPPTRCAPSTGGPPPGHLPHRGRSPERFESPPARAGRAPGDPADGQLHPPLKSPGRSGKFQKDSTSLPRLTYDTLLLSRGFCFH